MAVDKKFLKKHNLLEAHKHFLHLINEATYFSGQLDEEGEDDPNAQQPQGGAMPPMDPNGGQDPMQDGEMPQGGNMPPQDGGMDPNANQGNEEMSPMDPNGGQDPMQDGGDMMGDPMGGDPNMTPMDEPMGEEEEEVIDVEDITDAQEKTHGQVNKIGRNLGKVDNKIEKLLATIGSMMNMIDANNKKIESFEKEFERRNPTPTEKLNLRSLDSYPFNVNPKDYWDKKRQENRGDGMVYDAYADNSEPTSHVEYVLTDDDVENFDEKAIADSFHIDDDLRQTIEKIFDI